MLLKISLFFLLIFNALSAHSEQRKFQYKSVEYTTQSEFTKIMDGLGEDGWELTSCVTSGASAYTATTRDDVISGLRYARTSYCVFKKDK
jgi:hypothetical protein